MVITLDHGEPTGPEVRRRIPAAELIEDEHIQHCTLQATAQAPDYFWKVPASTSGFHHPICRGERGLWAHTLMVCTAVERLVDSYEARFDINPDHARAAAILHDQRKNGDRENPSDTSVSDHDLRMASFAKEYGLPDPVSEAIAEHMGAWYDGPEPSSPLSELVHNADMMASTANATLAVPGPIPEELEGLGLEEADL
ncbi:HDIG domain-containing metalloprotein [Haloarcula salinisoli]|uniref:HDIG domain-containing metalloprotein n=1 Tax=Haloarcula salinisoli TaxID=2487746 RepID=UPI0022A77308|nr:HDIG domain-containing metalloprotein [Halomicroarcula salinisoli]